MVWASKGFIFIRINPSFHLHDESLRLMNNDFVLFNDQSKTLTEVADLMNFETASHFSRYVKKLLGKSPSEYRQK